MPIARPGFGTDLTTDKSGGVLVFVNIQVKAAPAFMAVAGTVRMVPARVPMAPVLPVIALFASVQLADVSAYVAARLSVSVTLVPIVATGIAAGATGAAVPATVVEMAVGVLVRLVWVNEKGPPKAPTVTLLTATVGILVLEKVQVKSACDFTAEPGMVSVDPASVPITPLLPVIVLFASIQLALVNK